MRIRPLLTACQTRSIMSRAVIALTLSTCCATPAAADRGRWTSVLDTMGGTGIHAMLVRGDGAPYHSRVVWWQGHTHGRVWGWVPGNDDCALNPRSGFTALGWSPGLPGWQFGEENLLCSGHSTLANGDLFTAGGDGVQRFGLIDARTYRPAGGQLAGDWTFRPRMRHHRWYPTVTTLRDGRALVTSGSKYQHVWMFGGRRAEGSGALAEPASPTGDSLQRFGPVIAGGHWDAPVKPQEFQNQKPVPREGLTAVPLNTIPFVLEEVYFGGRDAQGDLLDDVWFLRSQYGAVSATDESYAWTQLLTFDGTAPSPRTRHSAIALSSTEMIVFGGLDANGPQNDIHRLRRNNQIWSWDQVQVTGGSPPSARFGHSGIIDVEGTTRRMLVYGGVASSTSPTPIDEKVWIFTFSSDGLSGTWSELTPQSDLGQPGTRYGHTMVADPVQRTDTTPDPDLSGRAAIMFGGEVRGGTYPDTLWALWITSNAVRWQPRFPPSGQPAGEVPAGRARHAAILQPDPSIPGDPNPRLIIHGGETSAGPADGHVFSRFLYGGSADFEIRRWRKWAAPPFKLSGHAMSLDQFISSTLPARVPEIYHPATNTWTEEPGAALFQQTYPQTFVVPGGTSAGGRVVTVGPYQPTYSLEVPAAGQPLPAWQARNSAGFDPFTAVLYRPDRILAAGSATSITGTTKTLDVTSLANSWVSSGSMEPRNQHNLVVLPDGKVLVAGGVSTLNHNTNQGPVRRPQIWDPATGIWTSMTDANERLAESHAVRGYHSTALLLPDGRVLCTGGNGAPPHPDQTKADIFCPPYLFKPDGSPAPRPQITSAPQRVRYGGSFIIQSPFGTTGRQPCLIRAGAATHGFDQNQRYVPLAIVDTLAQGSQMIVRVPADSSIAPPGDYLLFLLDANGTPAVARWVRVGSEWSEGDATAPGLPPSFGSEAASPTAISVTVTAPGDNGQNGHAWQYDLRYSLTSLNTGNVSAAPQVSDERVVPAMGGTIQSFTIGGLSPCTQYYVAIRVMDESSNYSAWSFYGPQITSCGGGCGGTCEARAGEVRGDERAGAGRPASDAAPPPESGALVIAEFFPGPEPLWSFRRTDRSAIQGLEARGTQGIAIQSRDAVAGWVTRFWLPSRGAIAIRSLVEAGRVVALDPSAVLEIAVDAGSLELASLRNSRTGLVSFPAADTSFLPEWTRGDTLMLSYRASTTSSRDHFFMLRGAGSVTATGAGEAMSTGLPEGVVLRQNRPNPIEMSTSISSLCRTPRG